MSRDELIQTLKGGSPEERRQAAKRLGRFRGRVAFQALAETTAQDPDFQVAQEAAKSLTQYGGVRAISPLVSALANLPDHASSDHINVFSAFLAASGTAAVDAIVDMLARSSRNRERFWGRARSVVVRQGAEVVPTLTQCLGSDSAIVRGFSAQLLGDIKDMRGLDPLIAALQDPVREVVVRASEALAALNDVRAVEPLIVLMRHRDAWVRREAGFALIQLGDARAVEPVCALLDDEDASVRSHIAGHIHKLGTSAAELLIERLLDPGARYPAEIAVGLAGFGAYAVRPLIYTADRAPERNAIAAIRGMSYLRGLRESDMGVVVQTLLEQSWTRPDVGPAAFESLCTMRDVRAASVQLRIELERQNSPYHRAAAEALMWLGAADQVALVLQQQGIPSRLTMVRAFSHLLREEDAETLLSNRFAVRFFWESESLMIAVLTGLRECVRDRDPRVREAALDALEAVRDRAVPETRRGYGQSAALRLYQSLEHEDLRHPAYAGLEQAIQAAASVTPERRFADVTLYHDSIGGNGPRVADAEALQSGTWYRLEVAIRVKPVGLPMYDRVPFQEPVDESALTKLLVTADGSADVEIREPSQTLWLPARGDSKRNAWFRIRPTRPSTRQDNLMCITLHIYYSFVLIETISLHAHVVGHSLEIRSADPELSATIQAPSEETEIPTRIRQESQSIRPYRDLDNLRPRNMHIHVKREEDRYCLYFALDSQAALPATVYLRDTDLEDINARTRTLWSQITRSKTLQKRLEGDENEYLEQVRALSRAGEDLWTILFRREAGQPIALIGEWLYSHPMPDDCLIQITIDEKARSFVFPWSLLYDRPRPEKRYELPDWGGFWGARYQIEQRFEASGWVTDEAIPISEHLDMAFILWDRFPTARAQRKLMARLQEQSNYRARISDPPIYSANECYGRLQEGSDDILYFYTHGHTRRRQLDAKRTAELEPVEQDGPTYRSEETSIELTSGVLELSRLYLIDWLLAQPFVILNMCESAQITPSLSDGFIHFFLTRGASAVVGTECEMTTCAGHHFSKHFLTGLFSGEQVGRALLGIRRLFLRHRNPLGLAYTLYGSATLCFQPPCIGPPDGSCEASTMTSNNHD